MGDTPASVRWEGSGVPTVPVLRRFTVDEYHRMGEAGILHEDERVELLEGEIMQMAPIGSRHADCVDYFAEWLITRLAGRAVVRIQNPVRLSAGSEPEPDLALVRPRPGRYAAAHPAPEDVFLIVEVADTTLRYDREVKLPLYAGAGIPEVWIVDLEGQRVLVYRKPNTSGYEDAATVERGGTLSPLAFPELALRVDHLLG